MTTTLSKFSCCNNLVTSSQMDSKVVLVLQHVINDETLLLWRRLAGVQTETSSPTYKGRPKSHRVTNDEQPYYKSLHPFLIGVWLLLLASGLPSHVVSSLGQHLCFWHFWLSGQKYFTHSGLGQHRYYDICWSPGVQEKHCVCRKSIFGTIRSMVNQ